MSLELFQYDQSLLNTLGSLLMIFAIQAISFSIVALLITWFSEFATRIDPRPYRPHQVRHEVLGTVSTFAITTFYLYLAFQFVDHVMPASATIAVLQALGFLVIYDFYMYVTHRLFHRSFLNRFHARHHTAVSATAWSSVNLHPVEAVVNYAPFLVFAMVSPVSLLVLLGMHAYLLFGIATGHSNHTFIGPNVPQPLRELALFHQAHHSDGRANFGYLFTHYDYLFNTRHKD